MGLPQCSNLDQPSRSFTITLAMGVVPPFHSIDRTSWLHLPQIGFAGRLATIATMHRKEQVIAPALETELGLTCQVPL
jgi:hypothetical protein